MRLAFVYTLVALGTLHVGSLAAVGQDSQHGEQVVPANQAAVDAPVRRHAKALWFELSNSRKEGPFGSLTVDFRRVGEIPARSIVVLAVKGERGRIFRLPIKSSTLAAKQGSLQGRPFKVPPGAPIEAWVEQFQKIDSKTMLYMKVSKSVATGNIGQLTLAREWTPEEKKAFENWRKRATPPPPPPAGYQLVRSNTKLLGGMPVLANRRGQWEPAEAIDVRKTGTIAVKFRDTERLARIVLNWVAVDTKTLEAGRSNPSRFRASAHVLPGGTAPVPDDLLPIEADTPLVKGTPVKMERAGEWRDATLILVREHGKLRIHWDSLPSAFDQYCERAALLITPQTLAALKKPGAAEEFAKRAEKTENPIDTGFRSRPRRVTSYPINIPIPENATRVTAQTPLEPGIRLGCAWGRRWRVVTVLDVNDDGTLRIHWEEFSDAWDGDALRDNLIIEQKVLAKLEAKAKTLAAKSTAAVASPTESEAFKVVLKEFGTRKVAVVKVVMEASGLDLKDAKEFVESAPITIKQNLSSDAAKKLRAELETAGATAAIELQ